MIIIYVYLYGFVLLLVILQLHIAVAKKHTDGQRTPVSLLVRQVIKL